MTKKLQLVRDVTLMLCFCLSVIGIVVFFSMYVWYPILTEAIKG